MVTTFFHHPARQLPLPSIDPKLSGALRQAIYGSQNPPAVRNLDNLVTEFENLQDFIKAHASSNLLTSQSGSGRALFESDDKALLEFLKPSIGAGVPVIQPYRMYHDPQAGNFIEETIQLVDEGQTVILDLGNANPEVMSYFSEELSTEIFNHQVDKCM
jgi:hypothetical protein